MTRKSFYRALRKLNRAWRVGNTIRCSGGTRSFCPITAVAYAKMGHYYETWDYDTAARAIKLPVEDAEIIMKSADSRNPKDKKEKMCRKALERAVNG